MLGYEDNNLIKTTVFIFPKALCSIFFSSQKTVFFNIKICHFYPKKTLHEKTYINYIDVCDKIRALIDLNN